ncbi:MAG: hypothetical protein RR614_04705 [Eubacterium sp.]
MENKRIEGFGTLSGGEYNNVRIEGIGQCKNDLKVQNLRIEGTFNCSGKLDAVHLHCEGIAEFEESITAKKIITEGFLQVKKGTAIEADEIFCDGFIKIDGQISADVITADGCINAREIVGDAIVIHSHVARKISRLLFFNFSKITSKADLIEATTIVLDGVKAKKVSGNNIVIGPGCQIEYLDCSGQLHIDKNAVVLNVSGEYQLI